MFSFSKFESNKITSLHKYVEPISSDYRVFVNDVEIPVYTCRVSKYPFNRAWPGYQRPVDQTELASFVNIVSDEKIEIKVVINRAYENIEIRPYSKKINCTVKDGEAVFALEKEGHCVLSCGDLHGCLYIFNSKPIECKNPEDVTYYFGPGVHVAGKIELKDNESVYVDKDALVFGCIFAENARGIKVFGNGLLDDSTEERIYEDCYGALTNGNIKLYGCRDVKIEGVLFKNSAMWCVNLFNCFNVEVDNIKVFGQWRYNTDGVDIVNCNDVVLKNSFIHSFDDSVVIKGLDDFADTNNENIITENCVIWCDWGKACELGLETVCREYKNIIFRNCDIIRGGNVALDIQNGDFAEIYDVLFENINVEYNSFDTIPVVQATDESKYETTEKMVPALISITTKISQREYDCNIDLSKIRWGVVHDVIFKNINVYYDEKIPMIEGKFNIPIWTKVLVDGVEYYDISVSNIKVNGTKVSSDKLCLSIEDTRGFLYDGI